MTARMTTGRVGRYRSAVLAALAIAATGLAILLWVQLESQLDPTVAALRTATQGALQTLYFDDLPPATHTGGPRPAPMVADMQARITADFDRYFTDRLQARYTPMIESAVDLIGGSDWDIDGGISSIEWHAAAILGDRATIGLRETEWVVRRHASSTYRLGSTWDVEATLVRETGQWRVDGFHTTCVSGCP